MNYNPTDRYPLNYLIQYITRENTCIGTDIDVYKLTNYRIIALIAMSLFSDNKRYKLNFDSIYDKKRYHYVTVYCFNADCNNYTPDDKNQKAVFQYIINLADAFIISSENNGAISLNFCISDIWKKNIRH